MYPARHPRNPHEDQESETRALEGGNPEYPTGTGSSVNLLDGLNPHQAPTTSAGDAPLVSSTRERRTRGMNIFWALFREQRAPKARDLAR